MFETKTVPRLSSLRVVDSSFGSNFRNFHVSVLARLRILLSTTTRACSVRMLTCIVGQLPRNNARQLREQRLNTMRKKERKNETAGLCLCGNVKQRTRRGRCRRVASPTLNLAPCRKVFNLFEQPRAPAHDSQLS